MTERSANVASHQQNRLSKARPNHLAVGLCTGSAALALMHCWNQAPVNNDPWSTLALLLGLSLAAALLNDALFFRGLLDNLAERVEMGLYALMLSLPATGFALLHWPRLTLLGLLTALLYALAQSQILQQHVKAQSNHRLANGDTTPKA